MEEIALIRLLQRFDNYKRALKKLSEILELDESRGLSDFEKIAVIQIFTFTHELAWKVMKDYGKWQGEENIAGSRDAIRYAFKTGLIDDGEGWMATIEARSLSTHTYNEETANTIYIKVKEDYHYLFLLFQDITQAKLDAPAT